MQLHQVCYKLRMDAAFSVGFALDRRWHWLRGDVEQSKEPDLTKLIEVLETEGIAYAVIGDVALQVRQAEPRTTLDINLVVDDYGALPKASLKREGFTKLDQHAHSYNWRGPYGTPIQFTSDMELALQIPLATAVDCGGFAMRVISARALLHAKLRAARDPARRRSKRLQDLSDAVALGEQDAELLNDLNDEERRQLEEVT